MAHLYAGFKAFDTPVSPIITIHGIQAGSGPPILLLHGFPQTHLIWHKIASRLTQHYKVIIIDIRGYGASSKPVAPQDKPNDHSLYAKSAMAQDCASLMTTLGHDTFFVCGHDRGGRVAHKLCVDHPDRVRKCLVLDICPTKAMYEATNMAFAQAYFHWFFLAQPPPFPEEMILASPEAMAMKCFGGVPNWREVFSETFEEYIAVFKDRATVHAMCEDYRASAQEDIRESTIDIQVGRRIKCPFMVLWGKRGVIEKMFDAKVEWAKVCEPDLVDQRSCALDCGHFVPEEKPDELLKHIGDFFDA